MYAILGLTTLDGDTTCVSADREFTSAGACEASGPQKEGIMIRATSTRLGAVSAAVLMCVIQTSPSSDAGSIFHRRPPATAAAGSQPTLIVLPQPAATYLYTLPIANFPTQPAALPATAGVAGLPLDVTAGVDLTFANEVAAIAGDPQYAWLAARLGGDPTRVKALKDHLRVVLLREMRRQNGRVQAINWRKFLENAAIVFLKGTYAFNAVNPWEPALAIIQRLIVDILREEGLLDPLKPDCPPPPHASPTPSPADPAPGTHFTRARIVGTVDLEIVDPAPDLTPAPSPSPVPAPPAAPDAPNVLPEPLPRNDDAAPPPPAIP
jgi:hypothetical protein